MASLAVNASIQVAAVLNAPTTSSNAFSQQAPRSVRLFQSRRHVSSTKICASKDNSPALYIGYNPKKTVFPGEACDELGEEYCGVEGVFDDVKLPPRQEQAQPAREGQDRDTITYDGPKTVFPGEACDDLGGEFCEPEYQEGVGKEQ